MGASRSLPVLIPHVPEQRWSCHSCGNCCRTLVGNLTEEERRRIDEQGWAERLGVEPYVRVGSGWALNKHEDGACVFLDERNLCRIHAEFGEAAKPLACRMFPFSLRQHEHGWQASLRFDCPSVIESKGEPLGSHRQWLAEAAASFTPDDSLSAEVKLARGMLATHEEIDALIGRMTRVLTAAEPVLSRRLVGLARATAILGEARFAKVRGARFGELLDVVLGAVEAESRERPAAPTPRQQGMLRQLAFAHAEHLTLQERRAGYASRWRRRWRQLRDAGRFRRGVGVVPKLPGFAIGPTFARVASVRAAAGDAEAVAALIRRYATTRILSRSVFGWGYYGWGLVPGLSALWLSVGVTGWLARLHAAGAGREVLDLKDVEVALGVVDRAASRVPALGTFAERARVAYLTRDDGVARLLAAWSLTDDGNW